jgi:tetratricopeptide (TPR) repeat protein
MAMSIARVCSYGLAAAVLALAAPSAPGRAADEDTGLRRKVLALNDITGSDPADGEVKKLAADPDGTKKLLAEARKIVKEKDQPLNINATFILARAAQELKQVETSEAFYRVCIDQAIKLQSGAKMADAYRGLILLFNQNKQYAKAVKVANEVLELKGNESVERFKSQAMVWLIQSLAREGKIDQALKLVDDLTKARGEEEDWRVLELRGMVLREAGRLDEAVKTYQTVLDQVRKDKALKKEVRNELAQEVRYLLSGLYVDLKQIDKAAEHLEALLKEKPDNPTYNNDLGYIWADHDMHLDKAEKLIRKALEEDRKQRKALPDLTPEEDKDNAAYLDSLGWVLYKQKKYPEAKKHLLEAIKEKEGQHIEIMDHLGDVHMALGEKDKAVAVWKKALELDNAGKREQAKKKEVEKKLNMAVGGDK